MPTLRLKSSSPHHIIIEPWTAADHEEGENGETRTNARMRADATLLYDTLISCLPYGTTAELTHLFKTRRRS